MMSVLMPQTDQFRQFEERMLRLKHVLGTRAAIAQTPKKMIWALNKSRLFRYVPVMPEEKRHRIPVLLVFALMNRPFIFDLRPGHSFVEFMLHRGYDVYLLDWGVPGIEDKHLRFDDYTLEYMPRAIRKLLAVSDAEDFSMIGWCIGAILSTSYAALRPEHVRNLLLLTAPLDFSQKDKITFARWVDQRYFNVDKVLDAFGNMPAEMIEYGAKALKPVENFLGSYMRLFESLDHPRAVESWHAMNTWVTDNIPMSGGAFRQLIVELYRQNRLIESNWILGGERVDLKKIRANLLTVIAEGDHITPPCQSETIVQKVSSEVKETFRIPGGHIGIMAGSSASKLTWPHIDGWLGPKSE
jgi:polyhydroxyalkanoate synthase subunit PhaC